MKLTRRSNGIFMVSHTGADGRRIRKSTGCVDRKEAEARALVILTELHQLEGQSDWTLNDALFDCYRRIWKKQKTSVHVLARLAKLEREFSDWVHLGLEWVTYAQLVKLTTAMEDIGLADATINRYLALISKALTEAVKLGQMKIKPPLPYRKESKGKLRWITRDEEEALTLKTGELWPEADARALRCLIIVLVDTGCRLSEILGTPRLPVKQLTLTDTKNGGSRSVPLTPRAREVLPHIPHWTPNQAIGRFSRLRDACGLHDVSLHTLRHTCASRLVQGGMDLYRVKEWLGHSSITVTQRYAHLAESSLAGGVDILAQIQSSE